MSNDTKRITRCLTFIKENTVQVEKILDRLIEDNIIGLDVRAEILSHVKIENQIHALIEIVIRKRAHECFIQALRTSGNNHVADEILNRHISNEHTSIIRENTYTVDNTTEEDGLEKTQNEMYVKEKTLEELKIENERLKTQQSIVRKTLNENHEKIQTLKLQIAEYKRENTELNSKLKSYEELQTRMHNIEEELENKDEMNKTIELALSEKSEQINRLQKQCEELKVENEEKAEQISNLNIQMKALTKDRKRLEQAVLEMSLSIEEKFCGLMAALNGIKEDKQAQCEVTTPEDSETSCSNLTSIQNGRKCSKLPISKSRINNTKKKHKKR